MKVALILLAIYFLYASFLYVFQRQMIFPRMSISDVPLEENMPDVEKRWLNTDYGKVEVWFMPPDTSKDKERFPAVIFGHGNAEVIDHWPIALKALTQMGIGVLLVEYPGYGRSEGTPSQKSIAGALVTAYDHLISRNTVDRSRIILFGRSVGGGAVCSLAAVRPSAALVLMSTFTSVRSFARQYGLPGFLVRDPFDNLSVISAYKNPVLIVHGNRDTIIPFQHAALLSKKATKGKMIAYDCGHNDCPPNWREFWKDVRSFFAENGIL